MECPREKVVWQRIPHLGVLWTDDRQALQLGWLDDADQDAANALARRRVLMAADGMTAATVFDMMPIGIKSHPRMYGAYSGVPKRNFAGKADGSKQSPAAFRLRVSEDRKSVV